MPNTLTIRSDILWKKSKFFLFRAVTYFSFLFIPIWLPKVVLLPTPIKYILMGAYGLFMIGQWFLLGKEIDHRLKIYFKVNSSIDRVTYRIHLGMFFAIIYFNVLCLFPGKWIYNLFWATWALLGLFYSWPTRGRIIQESVSSNFQEFKYLDRFEKTLLLLIGLIFTFSIPETSTLISGEALKLFFDSSDQLSEFFWNFLTVNYYPFKKYPELFKLAWNMHFYFIVLGMFFTTFYTFLRYFFSRRLSLLGLFAFLSTWSFSKILVNHFGIGLYGSYTLLWIWACMWASKSSTYRSGLFLGLVSFWGVILNQNFIFLLLFQMIIYMNVFLSEKTFWYKKQTFKYAILGIVLSFIVFIEGEDRFPGLGFHLPEIWADLVNLISRKAFYSLSILGAIIVALYQFKKKWRSLRILKFPEEKFVEFSLLFGIIFVAGVLLDAQLMTDFSLLWPIVFFALIPIEFLFQSLTRFRSKRNMIYLTYILICLLDSHFEGRIKIFLRMFD